jgi:hypothetical protein
MIYSILASSEESLFSIFDSPQDSVNVLELSPGPRLLKSL